MNLLEPGETPYENAQFVLFLVAVIKAVDDYQDLLRVSAASAGNDHRLGANEAPPAIVSMFLGDELSEILEALESGSVYKGKEKAQMEIGVTTLPHFPKDATDRNRTSPFAFTGNKFEFRMLGSMFSASGPNIVLNTAVAESLRQFADALEKSKNFKDDMAKLVKKTFREHKRIVFNGNNYSKEWVEEAARRGLSNLKTTVDALPAFISQKSVDLFKEHHVFTEAELHSRYEILLESYCKILHIEALTMTDITRKHIIPACLAYQSEIAKLLANKKSCGSFETSFETVLEERLLGRLSQLSSSLLKKLDILESAIIEAKSEKEVLPLARFYRDKVFVAMSELRLIADEIETLTAKKYWSLPTYGEILFSVI
jgi:glutamine synthetase